MFSIFSWHTVSAQLIVGFISSSYIYFDQQKVYNFTKTMSCKADILDATSHMCISFFFFLLKILFIYSWETHTHTHTHRGRDTGRGRSRLHTWSPMWDLVPGLQDHALGWSQALNCWATQGFPISAIFNTGHFPRGLYLLSAILILNRSPQLLISREDRAQETGLLHSL